MARPQPTLTLAEVLGLNRRRKLTARVREVATRMLARGERLSPAAGCLLLKVEADGGERGITPLTGVYPGGLLATLKSLGLLSVGEPDRLGDRAYHINDDGRLVARALRGRRT